MAKIGWGITGAGHFLSETFEIMEKIAKKHEISCFVSSAAQLVISIYGLSKKLSDICPGGYYREIISEMKEGPASSSIGRFLRKTYDVLIVSPASANTVAKIVSGISDTLVTNAVAQAGKGKVQTIIVPTDQSGPIKTVVPPFIDRGLCEKCERCLVIDICPTKAIVLHDNFPRIDLFKCNSCGICLDRCPHGAVSLRQEVVVTAREIDIENVEQLRKMPNLIVLTHPREIPHALTKILGEKA